MLKSFLVQVETRDENEPTPVDEDLVLSAVVDAVDLEHVSRVIVVAAKARRTEVGSEGAVSDVPSA